MYGRGGRTSYNVSAQHTTNQEMLLNLVRLRYFDTPYFLELDDITTQFKVTGKLASVFDVPGLNENNPANLGAEVIWSNQPTIRYSPLEGKKFATQLMQPLRINIVQGLILNGWDVDRVFRLLVQNMAGIPNACLASAPMPACPPTYKRFVEMIELMRYFQTRGELQVGVSYVNYKPPSNTATQISLSTNKKTANTITISFPSSGDKADRLAELLDGTKQDDERYFLVMRQDLYKHIEKGIITRSLLSTMYYLSSGVQVPPRDIDRGTVALTKNCDGKPFNWNAVAGDLLKIHWAPHCPDHAYLSVPYRGYWFYIDDTDVKSKRTFVLLQQIFNLQAQKEEKDATILTLPLGISRE